MSSDKHKMQDAAMKLMLDKRAYTFGGMSINRLWGWGQFHKPSDNPVFQYMIDKGYATREREINSRRTSYTRLVPTEKWLKIVADKEVKDERQRRAETGALSAKKKYPETPCRTSKKQAKALLE